MEQPSPLQFLTVFELREEDTVESRWYKLVLRGTRAEKTIHNTPHTENPRPNYTDL